MRGRDRGAHLKGLLLPALRLICTTSAARRVLLVSLPLGPGLWLVVERFANLGLDQFPDRVRHVLGPGYSGYGRVTGLCASGGGEILLLFDFGGLARKRALHDGPHMGGPGRTVLQDAVPDCLGCRRILPLADGVGTHYCLAVGNDEGLELDETDEDEELSEVDEEEAEEYED